MQTSRPVIIAIVLALQLPAVAIPKIYIDKGACPFECCSYRQWSVLKDTVLYEHTDGVRPVGKLSKGQSVMAVTGEVHLVPTPIKVVFPHGRFHVGDQAYLLTNEGEGVMKVWLNGTISEENVWFVGDSKWQDWGDVNGTRMTCAHPTKQCWGRIAGVPDAEWWILIKTPAGKLGWTKDHAHFGNQDACGSPS